MKRVTFLLVMTIIFSVVCSYGCERRIIAATFKESTTSGSSNNTFSIIFQDDKRFDKKYYDILLKPSRDDITINIKEEYKEDMRLSLGDKDKWQSLTTLIVNENKLPDTEDFMKFKDAVDKTFIITTSKSANLTFKIVVGDKFKNSLETGYLLANQEDISKDFKLKLKPLNEN